MSQVIGWLREARAMGASDLHLVGGLPPAVRLHGEIRSLDHPAIARDAQWPMVEELVHGTWRDHLERTRELCFSFTDGEAGRVRVTVYFHAGLPELAVRLCFPDVPDARTLGLPEGLDDMVRRKSGLVLVAGATGMGKTTTLAHFIDVINRERAAKIVTIEDPVEYLHKPIRSIVVQQEVHTDTLSFARGLIHVLRQNPDVIVLGEIREMEAIRTALVAAETGHLVLATVHTPSTVQTIERITSVFPAGEQEQIRMQLASTLIGVLLQDLIPRVDQKGRVLACEVMPASPAVRNNIREGNLTMLWNTMDTGRRDGMVTMDQSLLELYQRGVITYEAAMARVRNPARFAAGMAR